LKNGQFHQGNATLGGQQKFSGEETIVAGLCSVVRQPPAGNAVREKPHGVVGNIHRLVRIFHPGAPLEQRDFIEDSPAKGGRRPVSRTAHQVGHTEDIRMPHFLLDT
jgi:hypothetical protein